MDARETKIYVAIIITAIVLGVIIIYFAVSIIRQQRRNMGLQKALILAEIATLEKERTRIAGDLHDDLGPVLSVIKFRVDFAKGDNEELQKASEQLDEIVVRIREIAADLMPVTLQRRGLSPALIEFLEQVKQSVGFTLTWKVPENIPLPHEKSLHIFRTCQELIHNSIKHAQPGTVRLDLGINDKILLIDYADDGKGFEERLTRTSSRGIGMASIQNRTELLGGAMYLDSKRNSGTRIQIEIPV